MLPEPSSAPSPPLVAPQPEPAATRGGIPFVPGWLGGRGQVREQPGAQAPADTPEGTDGLADVQEIGLDGANGANNAGEKDTARDATDDPRGSTEDDEGALEASVAETVVYGVWSRLYRQLFCSTAPVGDSAPGSSI